MRQAPAPPPTERALPHRRPPVTNVDVYVVVVVVVVANDRP
ncbi:hypothetical protein [Sorangium sp. So ce363]